MKLKIPLGVIIGLILGIIFPNIFVWTEINGLKNQVIQKDDEIIELHKTIDSLKNVNHRYEIDLAGRQAYYRQAFYPVDTLADTIITDSIPMDTGLRMP
jgi:hypothetical protein